MENDRALREELIRQVRILPEDRLQDVLHFVESLRSSEQSTASVEDKIAAIVEEEQSGDSWKDVPADGAERHDHYIYGRPKADS
jgi:hypothetical protein